MKKGKIILIIVIMFLVIGVISGITHNLTGTTSEDNSADESTSTAETILENNTEIIWKDDERMGIVNLELDGTKTKEGIIAQYYTDLSSYLKSIDKDSLKDYEYIQFVGNVVNDGKIECTIRGNLTIEFIKTSNNLTPAHIESNMQDLSIPKPLQ